MGSLTPTPRVGNGGFILRRDGGWCSEQECQEFVLRHHAAQTRRNSSRRFSFVPDITVEENTASGGKLLGLLRGCVKKFWILPEQFPFQPGCAYTTTLFSFHALMLTLANWAGKSLSGAFYLVFRCTPCCPKFWTLFLCC